MNHSLKSIFIDSTKNPLYWAFIISNPYIWLRMFIPEIGIANPTPEVAMKIMAPSLIGSLIYMIFTVAITTSIRNRHITENQISFFRTLLVGFVLVLKSLVFMIPTIIAVSFINIMIFGPPSPATPGLPADINAGTIITVFVILSFAFILGYTAFGISIKDRKTISYKGIFSNIGQKFKIAIIPSIFFAAFSYIPTLRQGFLGHIDFPFISVVDMISIALASAILPIITTYYAVTLPSDGLLEVPKVILTKKEQDALVDTEKTQEVQE